jgi:hypothetical protein
MRYATASEKESSLSSSANEAILRYSPL